MQKALLMKNWTYISQMTIEKQVIWLKTGIKSLRDLTPEDTCISHIIVLHSLAVCRCCFVLFCFYKLKGYSKPMSSKFIDAIFITAFPHFISLGHILIILRIFQTLLLSYLLWWSVVSNLWCHYYDLLKIQIMVSTF